MKQKTKFKQTEFGPIPEDWETDKLENHLVIKGRIGWKGLAVSEYTTEGPFIVGGLQIKQNNIVWDECAHVTEARYEESPEIMLRESDILMTKDGTIGKLAYIKNLPDKATVASHIHVIRRNSDKILPQFLFYFFKSPRFQNLVESKISGSVVPALIQKDINSTVFPLPSMQEQNVISRILSDLDSKIELNQQMNKTLESIGRAIFKHWFVDFEFPNEEGKPYRTSGGEMGYNKELGKKIPKEWQTKKLNEISDNFDSKRIPLSSRERESKKGPYPYYGATGILDNVNDFIFDGTYVLIGEDGSVIDEGGYPILQYVWGKFWVNNHAHVLKGKTISNELLYMFLKNTNVSHIVTGAVQPKINQNNMNRLQFTIPEPKTLSHVQNILSSLFEKLKTNSEEINNLSRIRDSLLPKLMSGKIRVPVEIR